MVERGDVWGLGHALEATEGEVSVEAYSAGAAERARLTGVAGRFPRPAKGGHAVHFGDDRVGQGRRRVRGGIDVHDLRNNAADTLTIKTSVSPFMILLQLVLTGRNNLNRIET